MAELTPLSITLTRLSHGYRVNFRHGADATAQTVETLDEAVELGRAMEELNAFGITLSRLPGTGYYHVNFRDRADAAAQTAETLDEAVKLGRAMVSRSGEGHGYYYSPEHRISAGFSASARLPRERSSTLPKTPDHQRHPYRQIYRRNRLTPEEQRKANEGAVAFGIFCIVIGVIAFIFSLMTGIKFR